MKKNFENNPFERMKGGSLNSPFAEKFRGESKLVREYDSLARFADMAHDLTLSVRANPAVEKICRENNCQLPQVVSFSYSDPRGGSSTVNVKFSTYANQNRMTVMECRIVKDARGGVTVESFVPKGLNNSVFKEVVAPKLAELILADIRALEKNLWYKGEMPFPILPAGEPMFAESGSGTGTGAGQEGSLSFKEEIIDYNRLAGWVSAESTLAVFALEGKEEDKTKAGRRQTIGNMPNVQKVQLDMSRHTDCYVILTKYGFVIESPKVGRAAYTNAFDKPVGDVHVAKLKSGRMSNQDVVNLLGDLGVVRYLRMSRAQLYQEEGFNRKVHTAYSSQELKSLQADAFRDHLDITLKRECAEKQSGKPRLIPKNRP